MAGPRHRLVRRGHLRRVGEVEVALVDQALHELVEHLGERLPRFLVALPLAAQLLQHLGRELAAFDERLDECILERIERAVVPFAGPAPPGVVVRSAFEAALQQEIGEVLEQVLDVDGVEQRAGVLRVGREPHGSTRGDA